MKYSLFTATLILATVIAGCVSRNPVANKEEIAQAKLMAAAQKKTAELAKTSSGQPAMLLDPFMLKTFPRHVFIVAPPFPGPIPEPSRIFVVNRDGETKEVPDSKALEEFFRAELKAKTDSDSVVRSWLRLRMEFFNDGFFQFKHPDKSATDGPLVSATVDVIPKNGDSGSFKAILRFDDGKFVAVEKEENKLLHGIRPKCQATLLLHPEQLVRDVAWQSLLVMGSRAKPYLLDQRAKASEQLRGEIDRLLRQIAEEGR